MECLEFARNRNEPESQIEILHQLGLAYQALLKDDDALGYFDKGLKLSQKHNLMHKEGSLLLSKGNLYLEREVPDQAKLLFSQALEMARNIGDLNLEEGSMLSLAYAHYQLGTFDSIVEDFQNVLDRATTQKRYENLPEFLLFAVRVNIDEDEIKSAADSFEGALIITVTSDFEQLEQMDEKSGDFLLLPGYKFILTDLVSLINHLKHTDRSEQAYEFLSQIKERLHQKEQWGDIGSIIADAIDSIDLN